MVEISNLRDLDIYTMAGRYLGRVYDVVLNMRLGTISKFQVKIPTPEDNENEDLNIRKVIMKGFMFDDDEDDNDDNNQDFFIVNYDEVKAIGDIILIDSQNFEDVN